MNDKQFDTQFDALLKNNASENSPPKADEARKARNISTSQKNFSQAFANSSRLNKEEAHQSDDSKFNSLWRFFMKPSKNKQSYHIFATLAVAFVAVTIATQLPRTKDQFVTLSEPTTETTEDFSKKINVQDSSDAPEPNLTIDNDFVASVANESKSNTVKEAKQGIAMAVEQPSAINPVKGIVENQPQTQAQPQTQVQVQVQPKAQLKVGATKENTVRLESTAPTPNSSMVDGATLGKTNEAVASIAGSELEESVVAGTINNARPNRKQTTVKRTLAAGIHSRNIADIADTDIASFSPVSTDTASNTLPRPDSGEEYAEFQTSNIIQVEDKPVSTFSIDVDTASYSLIRNQLNNGYLPKPQAVRAEELINYFDYNYPSPRKRSVPFAPTVSVLDSPWNAERKLVHIGIKGYELQSKQQPDTNLVFLLDVSGSMNQANKLPLVKQSLSLLLKSLKPSDTVAIAVYAGAAGTVLEPTKVKDKTKIIKALNKLNAGGSTAGGQGLRLAYQLAEQNFNKNSINRIILATDGDFNVGQSSNEDLKNLVERKRDSGIYLSVLGFGRNNYQDDMMQTIAQNGNGIAAYIDTLSEAKKVLVDQAHSTLFPIAKDVKIQVEFNPNLVSDYRLVGYETRALKKEDFNNDKVDAGDIGAGHTVTAIYEISLANTPKPTVDPLRYQENIKPSAENNSEYGFLKIRYKLPHQTQSKLIETPIIETKHSDHDVQFSVAVAGFAQLLSNSNHINELTLNHIIEHAIENKGVDEFGYRSEFIQLVRMAKIAKH